MQKTVTAALVAALLSLTGAAQADTGIDLQANETPIHAPKNPQAIAKLPADFHFVKPGQFTVAIAALNTPPLALFAADNRRLIGSEVDIAQLVADSLGLELNVVQTSWEDWPLGVVSGKYDAAITNVTVTKERKTRFDFATYRIDSLGFYVKTGGKIATIKQPADIAGLKIIVGSGTNQEAILLAWDKQNRQQGLKPFQPIYVTDDAAATLAIQSGRADAYFGPNVLGAYKAALN
ncbi:TPA: transporter substrate-binding domain-containing protein, partial [Serratia marcescens]